jgi:hypothetical protein
VTSARETETGRERERGVGREEIMGGEGREEIIRGVGGISTNRYNKIFDLLLHVGGVGKSIGTFQDDQVKSSARLRTKTSHT